MYEITFITKEENDSNDVKSLMEKLKIKILKEESLGRKKFAYPIKKEVAGYYNTFYFKTDGKILTDLEKKILLNSKVLRFLIVKSENNLEKSKLNIKTEAKKEIAQNINKTKIKSKTKKDKNIDSEQKIQKQTKKNVKKAKKTKTSKKNKNDKLVKKQEEEIKEIPNTSKKQELSEEETTEEERLAKLEEKLDELLKD